MPFWIALQFLTRLPAPNQIDFSSANLGRSLLYYPLVGLIIGLCLVVVAMLTQAMSPLLSAALILLVWVAVTGALHLDGLADTVDAWIGGHGDQTRTLKIMKDPVCGPMAVVALVVVLLIKFAALTVIVEQKHWSLLLMAPVFGRSAVVVLLRNTPSARSDGLCAALMEQLPKEQIPWLLFVFAIVSLLFIGFWNSLFAFIAAAVVYAICRSSMMKRIKGTTGDTTGATLELVELAVLVAWAA